MSYYQILGLNKEPFSTSPDPEFFYQSNEHKSCLMRLLIEINLKRGLSLILGDVGTGKTTLSRKLFQLLGSKDNILFFMILDPTYNTEELFLSSLVRAFHIDLDRNCSILDYKQAIEKYLFQKGVEENKIVVLLIDEAQKLNELSLEILRVLLNYETNEYKLLQLILLSQMELLPRIREMRNLWDRISLKYVINPLDKDELREMINFRLHQAGFNSHTPLFTEEAIEEVYRTTAGYPRRIALLCHNALKNLVADETKSVIDAALIRKLVDSEVR
jgi:general secretion pathway protein A